MEKSIPESAEQVLAFEINFRAAQVAREAFGKIKGRGASANFIEIIGKFALKLRVLWRAKILLLQLMQGMHQGFRHESAAIRAEMAGGVGNCGCRTHEEKVADYRARVEKEESLPPSPNCAAPHGQFSLKLGPQYGLICCGRGILSL